MGLCTSVCNTERREHTPWAKPRVDYCLVARINGKVLYKVPLEVKTHTEPEDLRQLAHYMGQLMKEGSTGVGFIHKIRVAFSPFSLPDGLMLAIWFF